MGKINYVRVLLGGLVAGLVFNILELAGSIVVGAQFEAALQALGKELPRDPATMVWYLVLGFLVGIALVWIYAAIRPRFGPGPKTAVIAGLVGWFMTGVLNALGYGPIGIFPTGLWVTWMLLWLVELPLAALAGAWIYREGEAAAPGAGRPEPGHHTPGI